MSRRAYPSNPAVPIHSNQFPPSGSAGQTPYYGAQNVQSQPQPVGGYQAQLPGQPAQNFVGQPTQNFVGQPMQNVYGHPMTNQPQTAPNAPGPPQPSAQVPGSTGQNFPNHPGQSFAGPPPTSNVSSLAAGVQQMQMGQHAGYLPPGPPIASQHPGYTGQLPHPASAASQGPGPISTHGPPSGLRAQVGVSQPGNLRPPPTGPTLVGQATGQLPGRALSAGQLLPPTGPTVTGQATGQLPGRTLSAGQLVPPTGQVTGQLPGQTSHQPPGQILPTGQAAGRRLPPPPTSGQSMVQPSPSSGQVLPPPPSSGQVGAPPALSGQTFPTSGHAMPPPPRSGQTFLPPQTSGQVMPPPPAARQAMAGPPPTLGQMMSGPPPTSGQVMSGLPPTSGQMFMPPPPASGQAFTPSPTSGQMPPPPTSGQGLPPPAFSGQRLPPPPISGQALPTGPSGIGQPPGGPQAQPYGLGSAPPGSMPGPQMMTAPGQARPAGSGQATTTSGHHPGQAALDPELQPINLLESRNILPATPLKHPEAILPGNLGRHNPIPSVFCCTMNAIPSSSNLLSKLKLPLAVHIHPYREMGPKDCPVLHPGIIVRCRICRAYINPFVTFVDGRHWRCNLCFRANSLPEDFDFNPATGKHGDRTHRMELRRATVEYIAPSEYMLRPPQPSVYYFLVDVSYNAVETGVLGVFCRTLLDNLARLPGDARTLVGILTFDSTLHFYNLSSSLSQPQMLVVSDVDDVFLPSPNSLLVNLRESRELVRTLLEDLPGMFASNRSIQSALGPALQAAEKLLHPIGGRVTVLMSTMPNVGPGSLKYRDVAPSSIKMTTLNMAPASDFYKKLALECSSQQIAVDLFCFSGQFIDLSTISCIAKFSSGQVFYYPDFHQRKETSRQKFEEDLKRYLTRKIGFEAVMRVRCTEGLSLHTFHGNFFVRSTDLLSLPNVNPDHGYTMNIAIDENLKEGSAACFQAALLYTSSKGERRIRVHTLCLPVSKQPAQLYAKLNIQAIAGVLAKMAVDRAASATLGDAREALMNIVLDCTKMYRSHFASSMQSAQFALPSSLRLLPLFMLSLLKHPAFSLNSKISYDVRTQAMNLCKTLPLDYLMAYMHPHMYALYLLTEKDVVEDQEGKERLAPPILQLSAEKMTRYGIFLMDYGLGMHIWVSKDAPQELIQKIFGVQHFGAIPETMVSLPVLDNEMSVLVRKLVKQVSSSKQHFMPLLVIREDGPHRLLFIDKLVEDRTEHGTSYHEFLTHVNRQLSK